MKDTRKSILQAAVPFAPVYILDVLCFSFHNCQWGLESPQCFLWCTKCLLWFCSQAFSVISQFLWILTKWIREWPMLERSLETAYSNRVFSSRATHRRLPSTISRHFWISPGIGSPHPLLANLCQCLLTLTVKEYFLRGIACISVCAASFFLHTTEQSLAQRSL